MVREWFCLSRGVMQIWPNPDDVTHTTPSSKEVMRLNLLASQGAECFSMIDLIGLDCVPQMNHQSMEHTSRATRSFLLSVQD